MCGNSVPDVRCEAGNWFRHEKKYRGRLRKDAEWMFQR